MTGIFKVKNWNLSWQVTSCELSPRKYRLKIRQRILMNLKFIFSSVERSAYTTPEYYYIARKFWRWRILRAAFPRAILAVVEVWNWLSHASIVAKKYYRFPSGERRLPISILSVNLTHRSGRKMQMLVGSNPFASSSRHGRNLGAIVGGLEHR